jgi:hypothetical protein
LQTVYSWAQNKWDDCRIVVPDSWYIFTDVLEDDLQESWGSHGAANSVLIILASTLMQWYALLRRRARLPMMPSTF